MNKKQSFVVLAVLGLIVFITEANAQCVQCSPQGRKFVCASSPKGGRICQTTSDGASCAVSSPCGSTANQTSGADIVLEEGLVAEVRRTEPQLARALSFLRTHTELLASGYAKLYQLPEVAEESAHSGAQEEDELGALLARISEREQKAPPVEPIVFEVTFERAADSASAILKIIPSSRKPKVQSNSLVVHLMKADGETWRVSGWDTRLAN